MIRFEFLEKLGLSVAAMSERSDGDYSVSGPTPQDGRALRALFCRQCGADPEGYVCGEQIHSANVACVGEADRGRGSADSRTRIPATDALVTNVPSLPLAVFVADCVPVFLFDPETRSAALVHAGREGTRQSIAEFALRKMGEEYGARPASVYAVIGPSAGPCCYEVSPEIAARCAADGMTVVGRNLDLWEENAEQLTRLGVPKGQIEVSGICTICGGRFHSYRRDGSKARNMTLLSI